MSVDKMYEISMTNKLIVSMSLPPIDENKYIFKTYKITPRAISAHAYVNAAFVIPYDAGSGKVTERPTLLFGGISDKFVHAAATERFLAGRPLADDSTLKGALTNLLDEVNPAHDPEGADVTYRKRLAVNLLYKVILHTLGDKAPAHLRSAGEDLTRTVSKGTQEYDTDKSLWPVNQAVPKLEAQIQTSGEAEYVDDQPAAPGELYGYYVLSTVAKAKINAINATKALAMDGVRAFFTADDAIGANDFVSMGGFIPMLGIDGKQIVPEQVFAKDSVRFCGQPIGLVVADSKEIARRAAALVHVEYGGVAPPILTIEQALEKQPEGLQQSKFVPVNITTGDAEAALKTAPHRASGQYHMGTQYHFTMETQTCRVVPNEDGQLNVYSASQSLKDVVDNVSSFVNVPANKINAEIKRLGGGYGGKITNPIPIAMACALAAVKLNRPVRIVLDIENNISMCSTRTPMLANYEVGFTDSGKMEALKMHVVCDMGYSGSVTNYLEITEAVERIQSMYHTDNWLVTPGTVTTDQQITTSTRAPGSTNAMAIIEVLMNRVAHELNMDPWEVRRANLATAEGGVPKPLESANDQEVFTKMVNEMFDKAEIKQRKADIEAFNKVNRYRKRSLALVPMRYDVGPMSKMICLISIYDKDGTVAVSHGGVEMGQGLNTKVAQTVAYELGIPLSTVSVKANNSLANPNGMVTGGSVGSEFCSYAAKQACQILLERLKPFRAQEGEPEKPWVMVVMMASMMGTNLTAHSMQVPLPKGYTVWGLTAAEAEVDILTGESRFNRVDLYEDAGQALSPWVDIGQIEGAFVMGMGLHLTELFRYDKKTGQRITNRAWSYYPPTHKDIPRDFRVKLLKNNKNETGIYNSKATGEPAVNMSIVCQLAVHQAIAEARRDAGLNDWVQLNSPATVEYTQTACHTTAQMFSLS